MEKTIIAEGKTTNEAIENGLKQLKVSKNMVDIKVLEEENKRSFFSILAPRVVKVELTVKENTAKEKKEKSEKIEHKEKIVKPINPESKEIKSAIERIENFLNVFTKQMESKDMKYVVSADEFSITITITGSDINYLIGYRGDTLNAMQVVLSSIANKNAKEKIRVILDIEGYRKKREKTLENLADKIAKTVIRNKKQVTLEPMSAYERKIIHNKLQNNNKVTTYSVGEEPNRKIVVALKK